ncbi:uncharacterized protein YjeT (DUF2065 family) [Streptomyces griseochromogenes]|uniref:Uncharacterized protein YjeT (DUF2065 family) n=1 Tax=Streptomyces griseochromogenes TaxID=68214 RepID=A0ABS4MA91_9ACTN|nr:hypothetical protein [Streptomyces griseochromogenes]MBP2056590.1 uncharacterized protein YjeT (DUF2065 family) [Streptomyces griseochromogenes]
MTKKNRTPSTTPPHDHGALAPASWRRLVSVELLAGAVRHIGALLAGFAVSWWQRD